MTDKPQGGKPGDDSAAEEAVIKAAEEAAAAGGAGEGSEELATAKRELAERTADLQRLQAEYQNYRKRVERDRLTVREIAVSNILESLIPVLDDIGRAREHGEVTGGFKSVAESLETVVAKLGLQQFGKEGEPFDPTQHEALMHSYSSDVTEDTCVQILQPGYRIGERIIRPAMVAVAEPQPGTQTTPGPDAEAESGEDKPDGGSDS
ncbi:nucleotide exchange factor GrpE [Kitasatospora aureofaciens]|uniref:Protein GrpE n=1 Tax=Kitasatospora aureofaciens TaxID=1894 RepID=A0A1E7NBB6_KITAU|nr:nucleotide exchange factor GrpE [Kitasatospora aureofaciens]QEV00728.1 nucleotide exchange factor GrpE [Streptomyces viridifaciens]ARF79536.1 nucleotide exchange factor GrpE [Kitasatospora aureofaciens]OEV37981.1 nucleotide exchange factor GrpE [Kitasatospora aureofaciens]UKZ07020.1 nucleotide exchange factor GrpE [Streptomyces viridifaciens]GGU65479.1 protein GrpE [Kitasatospora aureofaciens]